MDAIKSTFSVKALQLIKKKKRKGKFTEAPGPQAGGCPVGTEAGRGALFDILPGVQVVGVAMLLAAVDPWGYR